ncbi:hypothetical protein [Aeromonas caviae]|uniref:hypothetical protein n=1 Tax=Aeromonas caviae TaxID=648 RepID=UPI0038D22E45
MFCKNLSIGTKIAVVFAVIAAINVIFDLFLASEQRGMRDRVLNFTDSTLLEQGLKDLAGMSRFAPTGATPSWAATWSGSTTLPTRW